MPLRNGTTLSGGKYRIVRYISHGGFGCTYEGVHVLLGHRVAIKEFFPQDYCNRNDDTGEVTTGTKSKIEFVTKLRDRFIREASVISRFHHPGVVRVSDVFEENGTAYYVMDYIEGQSLAEMTRNGRALSEQEAVGYIRKLCAALDYVHSKKHLHLDIKPENIMVTQRGEVVLIDFGASKQYIDDKGGNTSTTFGLTPGYAPGELHSGDAKQYNFATDIYSVGATLYRLLSGQTPIAATTRSSGVLLKSLPAYISQPTCNAIESAMQLNRDARPRTVHEFLQILDGRQTSAGREYSGNTTNSATNYGTQGQSTKVMGANGNGYGGNGSGNGFNRDVFKRELKKNLKSETRKGLARFIVAMVSFVILALSVFIISKCDGSENKVMEDSTDNVQIEEVYESDSETVAEVEAEEVSAPEVTKAEKDAFARKVLSNLIAGDWEAGASDENGQGNCYATITNNNSFPVDGSDYYISYTYDYIWSDPPQVQERIKKKGSTIGPGSSINCMYYYSDDCSPSRIKLSFAISNDEVYEKYHGV